MRDKARKVIPELVEAQGTMWKKNHITVGTPCNLNFSCKEVVMVIFDHLLRVADTQAEDGRTVDITHTQGEGDDSDSDNDTDATEDDGQPEQPTETTPMGEHFCMFSGDGDPYDKLIRLKDVDETKYDRIMALLQMFHYYMKLLSKTNIVFQDVMCLFLADVIGTSDQDKKYFLTFWDLTKPEKYIAQFIGAIEVAMVRGTMATKGAGCTAVDVKNHVLRLTSPRALLLFLIVRVYNIAFLARKVVPDDDFEGMLRVVRLSSPLWGVTNSHSYMAAAIETIVLMVEASQAEKIIYEKTFTCKTESGTNVARDWIHEKYINAIRSLVGKLDRKGNALLIKYACLHVLEPKYRSDYMKLVRESVQGFTTESRVKTFTFQVETFVQVTMKLDECGIFSTNYDRSKTLFSFFDNQELNSEILFFVWIGSERVDKYV
jgi:hypothetical protein